MLKISLFVLLFVSLCSAQIIMDPDRSGLWEGGAVGGCMTGCDGTEPFCWTGEEATDSLDACESGGTLNGSLTGGFVNNEQNNTASGALAFEFVNNNDYLQWTVTTSHITDDSGYVSMYVWPDWDANTGYTSVLEYYEGPTNSVKFAVDKEAAYNRVQAWHEGNNVVVTIQVDDELVEDQWNKLELRWSISKDSLALQVNSNGWNYDTDGDPITAMTVDPTIVRIGEASSGQTAFHLYIDDVKTYPVWDTP